LFARIWPNASIAVEIAVAGALVIIILVLYRRFVPRSSERKKSRWWEIVEYIGGIVLFVLDTHWRYHKGPATVSSGSGWNWVLIVSIVVGVIFLWIAPTMVLAWMINKTYERGDHQSGMRLIDRFGRLIPRSLREDFRTMVLLYSGEPKQAESLIRSVLENRKEEALRNELNGTLGQALIDQGRYGEAEALFEQVIQGSPLRMGGYDGLAEVRILQGRPREAFELIDQAIRCEEARSGLVRRFEAYEQGHLWANRAWAEAASGWRAKAEQALERAFAAAGKHKPELAGVHYRAGMLWNALGSHAKAREHFRAARELDPEGRYGKKSSEAELIAIS
jgi:Tfp pilus assembly protein PilF